MIRASKNSSPRPHRNNLGSTRALACWFRRLAETVFPLNFARGGDEKPKRKFAIARARSSAREARALPLRLPIVDLIFGKRAQREKTRRSYANNNCSSEKCSGGRS